MDKDAYSAAQTTIQNADKDTLTGLNDAMTTLATAHTTAKAAVDAILASYPDSAGPAVGARSTVQNVSGQLAMLDYQMNTVTSTVTNALQQYTPAPVASPAPMPGQPS